MVIWQKQMMVMEKPCSAQVCVKKAWLRNILEIIL